MKRPLAWFSAVFLASLALSMSFGGLSGLMTAYAALLFAVCCPRRRLAKQVLLCGLLATLLALGVAWAQQSRLRDWQALEGAELDFTGWLEEDDPYGRDRGRVRGTVLWEGQKRRVTLEITPLGEDLCPGQWLSGRVLVLEAREDGDALGGVSLYAIALGEAEAVPAPEEFRLLPRLAALRRDLSRLVWEDRPGEPAAVVAAMLFSRQDLLSSKALDDFTASGLRHLLVVSGLHLSLAADQLHRLFRPLGKRGAAILSLVGVWLAAGLAGFSFSALRAAMMVSLSLLAPLFWVRADGLTSLACAALVLGITFPLAIREIGWQLTFSATLGILLGTGPMTALLENLWQARLGPVGRPVRQAAEGLSASFCANLLVLPILAARLGYFSLWGLFTSVLSMPLVMGILLCGGAGTGLLAAGLSSGGSFLLGCARLLARGLLAIAGTTAALPGGTVSIFFPWQLMLLCAVSAGLMAFLLLCPRLRLREARLLLRGLLFGLVLSLLYTGVYYQGGMLLSANDSTGMVALSTARGTVILCGGEGSYRRRMLSDHLRRCRGKEPLVLVCPQDLSLGGVVGWAEAFSPACILVREEDIPLLQSQLPGSYLPLTAEPLEVLPGVLVSCPAPQLILLEAGGRKVLKSWTGYDIIDKSALPSDADLFVDRTGRVFSLTPELSAGRLPTGDTDLILMGG